MSEFDEAVVQDLILRGFTAESARAAAEADDWSLLRHTATYPDEESE